MPLGNLTSQFFANVYLNELDQFVKHKLNAKYYIRYVDDFIILHKYKPRLEYYKEQIDKFLKTQLDIELHPDKSKILKLQKGTDFLGSRIFFHHKLVRKKNIKRFERKFKKLKNLYQNGLIDREKAVECFNGWLVYVSKSNTYKYRKHLIRIFNQYFPLKEDTEVKNIKNHQNFTKKIETSNFQFSTQKILQLFQKGLTIEEIAKKREIKENTVWDHIAELIKYNQISIWNIISKEKIQKIMPHIYSKNDKLKEIKQRIKDNSISYNDINCALAYVKSKGREKNIFYHFEWYKKAHCIKKCYYRKNQRKICINKFKEFLSKNPNTKMTRREFLKIFNNHINICILPENEKRKFVTWKNCKLSDNKPKNPFPT